MASERYEVEEIRSGVADNCLWVSIGFSSELEKLDVLHVVCAMSVEAQDRKLGQNSIYLERFDQAYSCYAGADSILVAPESIEVALNSTGRKNLSFPGKVLFVRSSRLKGWASALRVFKRMSPQECGRVVSVA